MLMMGWDFGGSPTKWNDLALLFQAENAAVFPYQKQLDYYLQRGRAKVLLTITSSYPISLIKTDINDLAALFKTNKRNKQFKSHKVQIEVWT